MRIDGPSPSSRRNLAYYGPEENLYITHVLIYQSWDFVDLSIGAGTGSTRDTENVWGSKDMTGTGATAHLIDNSECSPEERHESFAAAGCGS